MTTLMTTARTALGGLLAVALAPALWPGDAAAHTCDVPFTTDLVTGGGIDVGEVKVCNDADSLTVIYETTWPWCVLRTNLHVASDLAGIPKFSLLGTPNFLRFDFIEEVDCEVPVPLDIPLAEIGGGVVPGETVTIAARAVVEGEGPDGTHPRCLLGDKCVAWGEGQRFRPRLPAMYFTYEVQEALLCGGETSKCVFVTSTTHNGNLGGLAGADQICQDSAESAGSLAAPGTYKAWLSTAAAWPADGTRFTQASVPYKLVTGTTVASNWSELVDGLLARIDRSESAAQFTGSVWTGTLDDGTPAFNDCSSWLNGSNSAFGAAGCASFVPGGWSACTGVPCSQSMPIYCFQR